MKKYLYLYITIYIYIYIYIYILFFIFINNESHKIGDKISGHITCQENTLPYFMLLCNHVSYLGISKKSVFVDIHK